MNNPVDPESYLRNVAARTRRTVEEGRRAGDRRSGPRRVRFRRP